MWTCSLLKRNAKNALYGRYWRALLVSFLLSFLGVGGVIVTRPTATMTARNTWNEITTPDVWTGNGPMAGEYGDAWLEEYFGWDWYDVFMFLGPFLLMAFWLILVGIAIGLCWTAFVANPFTVGSKRFYMENRQAPAPMSTVVSTFRHPYLNGVKVMLLTNLKVWLGCLLFVIPGIYWSFCYAQVPYLLAENPYMTTRRAMELSREMMRGEKWHTFVLNLSFIGWEILSLFTFGIGLYFLEPYYQATHAELYAALRSKAFALGLTDESELGGFVVHGGSL